MLAVAALTLGALREPLIYYVRFVVLFPLSVPVLLVDWWGGVLLFGPDLSGPGATAFFVVVAVAAAATQALLVFRVARSRSRELP